MLLFTRYNSDPHVKRKLVIKLVQNGCLQIFINVFKSVHAADFLKILNPEENNENYQPSEDSMSVKDHVSATLGLNNEACSFLFFADSVLANGVATAATR